MAKKLDYKMYEVEARQQNQLRGNKIRADELNYYHQNYTIGPRKR